MWKLQSILEINVITIACKLKAKLEANNIEWYFQIFLKKKFNKL